MDSAGANTKLHFSTEELTTLHKSAGANTKLHFSTEELTTLHKLVEASLKIPDAKAKEGEGREKVLEALGGKSVMQYSQAHGNIVKRINLGIKQGRKRKCGWPSLPDDRAKVNERTAERREQGKPSPFNQGRPSIDGTAYIPSKKDTKLLKKLGDRISQNLNLNPEQMGVPKAVVSMQDPESERSDRLHRQAGICIQVAVKDGTSKVQVFSRNNHTGGAMQKGDVFSFDGQKGHTMPIGDWKTDIFFNAKCDPL